MAVAVGDRAVVALLTLLLLFSVPASGYQERGTEREEAEKVRECGEDATGRGRFILGRTRRVVRTEAGQVRVVSGDRWKGHPSTMHIGFLRLEPNSLFLPQYVDANLVQFVREGEVEAGWIHKDELVQRKLKRGDINVIPAGSPFYIANTNSERSHMVCGIDTSQSLTYNSQQSFFIGGGTNPTSVLAGFDVNTLANAFNITSDQLRPMMRRQSGGPIVHFSGQQEEDLDPNNDDEEAATTWTRKNLLDYLFGRSGREKARSTESHHAPYAFNLYNNEPSFQNSYGWSTAIDEHDYSLLSSCGVGVYLVNLTAGSMMAPHFNPVATEYGVILSGSGSIEVVYPNGSTAMNAEVSEGDVFWIPRYHPFCQVASRGGPMEFFGFTTSSKRNHPQFLAGASSVLRSMSGPELATAFGVSEEQLGRLVKAQRESVILPASNNWDGGRETADERKKEKMVEELLVIKRGFLA
ncbi:vicilin-like seed storage protein At2g28490 [Musa acuminata AAA Group]|uniref:vicilin-like seed storage protein At2g28490 n=1 Tax=Musa acuminata AAA Group TaxID=214697 RepID=UPI0031DBDFA9